MGTCINYHVILPVNLSVGELQTGICPHGVNGNFLLSEIKYI